MITIRNKKQDTIMLVNTGYRKGKKIVKFMGVTMAIEGRIFKKYWEIVK